MTPSTTTLLPALLVAAGLLIFPAVSGKDTPTPSFQLLQRQQQAHSAEGAWLCSFLPPPHIATQDVVAAAAYTATQDAVAAALVSWPGPQLRFHAAAAEGQKSRPSSILGVDQKVWSRWELPDLTRPQKMCSEISDTLWNFGSLSGPPPSEPDHFVISGGNECSFLAHILVTCEFRPSSVLVKILGSDVADVDDGTSSAFWTDKGCSLGAVLTVLESVEATYELKGVDCFFNTTDMYADFALQPKKNGNDDSPKNAPFFDVLDMNGRSTQWNRSYRREYLERLREESAIRGPKLLQVGGYSSAAAAVVLDRASQLLSKLPDFDCLHGPYTRRWNNLFEELASYGTLLKMKDDPEVRRHYGEEFLMVYLMELQPTIASEPYECLFGQLAFYSLGGVLARILDLERFSAAMFDEVLDVFDRINERGAVHGWLQPFLQSRWGAGTLSMWFIFASGANSTGLPVQLDAACVGLVPDSEDEKKPLIDWSVLESLSDELRSRSLADDWLSRVAFTALRRKSMYDLAEERGAHKECPGGYLWLLLSRMHLAVHKMPELVTDLSNRIFRRLSEYSRSVGFAQALTSRFMWPGLLTHILYSKKILGRMQLVLDIPASDLSWLLSTAASPMNLTACFGPGFSSVDYMSYIYPVLSSLAPEVHLCVVQKGFIDQLHDYLSPALRQSLAAVRGLLEFLATQQLSEGTAGTKVAAVTLVWGRLTPFIEPYGRRASFLGVPLVVFAMDGASYTECEGLRANQRSLWCVAGMSKGFFNKFSLPLILTALGVDTLVLDLDVLLLKNPLPIIYEKAGQRTDILVSRTFEDNCWNIGVFWTRASLPSLLFLAHMIGWLWVHPVHHDQYVFQEILQAVAQGDQEIANHKLWDTEWPFWDLLDAAVSFNLSSSILDPYQQFVTQKVYQTEGWTGDISGIVTFHFLDGQGAVADKDDYHVVYRSLWERFYNNPNIDLQSEVPLYEQDDDIRNLIEESKMPFPDVVGPCSLWDWDQFLE